MNFLKNTTSTEIIKLILVLLGIVSQIFGYIGLFENIFSNPYYATIFVSIGFVTIIVISLEIIFRKKNNVLNLVLVSGEKHSKKVAYYGIRLRTSAVAGILFFGLGYSFFMQQQLKKTSSTASVEDQKEYAIKPDFSSIADLYNIQWFMAGGKAYVGDDIYPYAGIVANSPESITTFGGDDCALSFHLSARSHIDEMFLDKIQVRVYSYQPLPEAIVRVPAPFNQATTYYVELDNPANAGKSLFESEGLYQISETGESHFQELAILRVNENSEYIVVRINARTPGLYTFSIEILVSSKDITERIVIVKDSTWLFDYDQYHLND